VAHVVLLKPEEALRAGESGLVQLVFDRAVCAVPGERFIVRDAQAAHTVGGGVVIDPLAPARRRRSPARMAWLAALERLDQDGVAPLLAQAPHGIRLSDLVRLTGIPVEHQLLPAQTLLLGTAPERFVLHTKVRQELRQRALVALAKFHEQVPDEPGADLGRLRRMAAPELPEALWRTLMEELLTEEQVMRRGAWWHLPGHTVTMSPEDQAFLQTLLPLIAAGRFDPPWVRQLAALVHEPDERVRAVLLRAAKHGLVHQVVRDLFYDRSRIAELANVLKRIAAEDDAVHAARYRDAVGLGRKRAIQILEFFDRVGLTRRIRDSHVLRPDSGWEPAP
jgi:selenocysteine-specific elongation factor